VFKLSLFVLAAVLAALVALALLPHEARTLPAATVALQKAQVTLYPQADPGAVWHFAASPVDYDPNSRQAILHNVNHGERTVSGKVDFTLTSPRITIDNRDNLESRKMFVHLVDANWDLHMQSKGSQRVYVDQQSGTFDVPVLDYSGSGIGESHLENVRTNFALTQFEAGGPGTTLRNQYEVGGSGGAGP
jgi:hypothetical protein